MKRRGEGGGGRERCREDIQEAHVKECKGEYLLAFSRDDKAPRLLCTAAALCIRFSHPPDFPPSLLPQTTTDTLHIRFTTLSSFFSIHLQLPSPFTSAIQRTLFPLIFHVMFFHLRICDCIIYRACIGNREER